MSISMVPSNAIQNSSKTQAMTGYARKLVDTAASTTKKVEKATPGVISGSMNILYGAINSNPKKTNNASKFSNPVLAARLANTLTPEARVKLVEKHGMPTVATPKVSSLEDSISMLNRLLKNLDTDFVKKTIEERSTALAEKLAASSSEDAKELLSDVLTDIFKFDSKSSKNITKVLFADTELSDDIKTELAETLYSETVNKYIDNMSEKLVQNIYDNPDQETIVSEIVNNAKTIQSVIGLPIELVKERQQASFQNAIKAFEAEKGISLEQHAFKAIVEKKETEVSNRKAFLETSIEHMEAELESLNAEITQFLDNLNLDKLYQLDKETTNKIKKIISKYDQLINKTEKSYSKAITKQRAQQKRKKVSKKTKEQIHENIAELNKKLAAELSQLTSDQESEIKAVIQESAQADDNLQNKNRSIPTPHDDKVENLKTRIASSKLELANTIQSDSQELADMLESTKLTLSRIFNA